MKALLPVRVEKVVRKENGDRNCPFTFKLKPVVVNKVKHGTFGFICDPVTGITVYVSTQPAPMPAPQIMYRFARDDMDYCGGVNHFCFTVDELAFAVKRMMNEDRLRVNSELGLG